MSRRIVNIPEDWMTEVHRRAEKAGFKRHQWGQYLLTMAIPPTAQRKLSPLPQAGRPKARKPRKGLIEAAVLIAIATATLVTGTVTLTVDYEAYRIPKGTAKQYVTDAEVQSGLYPKKRIRIPHTGQIVRVYQGLTGGTLVEMRIPWRNGKWTGITLDRAMLDAASQRIVDQWKPATAGRS